MLLYLLIFFAVFNFAYSEDVSFIEDQINKLKAHKALLERLKDADFPSTPCKNFKTPNVPLIRGRLLLHGILNNMKSKVIDPDFKCALKTFQKTHFFEPTGIFNAQTCQALNVPLEREIHKISLNIERLNNFLCEAKKAEKLIFVNVPQFKLYGLNEGDKEIEMDVIVGRPSRPTLLGRDQLSTVILNPTWTIPEQILLEDKIPIFAEDPEYLTRKNFSVFGQDQNLLDPSQIDWEDVQADPLAYRFRQNPGPKNTLGSFKFLLGNDKAIYLHDTNEKKLFSKTYRALSSGCIRLKQPKALAEWILKDYGNMPCLIDEDEGDSLKCVDSTIQDTLAQKGQKFLALSQKIPVILGYITTWVGDDDRLYVSRDPYKKDTEAGAAKTVL